MIASLKQLYYSIAEPEKKYFNLTEKNEFEIYQN